MRSTLSLGMIPKLAWLGVVMLTAASPTALANFQYTYVEATYLLGEYDIAESDLDIRGYRFTGQFDLSPRFVAGVSYASLQGEDSVVGTAGDDTTVGFEGSGAEVYTFYYSALGAQTDFLLGAGIDMREFEVSLQGIATQTQKNEETKVLFAGIRQRFMGLELHGRWTYNLDTEPLEDEWSYTLGVLSGQPKGLQLGVQFSPDDSGDQIGISLRQSY